MKSWLPCKAGIWPLIVLLLALISLRSLWALGLNIDDSVPEGFESLAGPRPLIVDVLFNDRMVGTAGVIVEGDLLSFDEPQLVLDMIDTVIPNEALRRAVASPQATNVDRLCYRPADPIGCGTLVADTFALLFDEDALTLTLFVDSALQQVQMDESPRYLNEPQRRGSAILSFDVLANTLGGQTWEYDLRGESWFGYGRGFVRSIASLGSQGRNARLESVALVHRLRDHELLAGSYAFVAGPNLTSFDVLGLRLETSLKTRIDPERVRGSGLSVLLDRRAIVRLYVEDRLYSTQSLEAGHVAVDTADLPDGSMEVEVRILDLVSGERIEHHRFTRSSLLPPRDQMAMTLAVGAPLRRDAVGNLPQPYMAGVGSARFAWRTGENTAVALGYSQLGKLGLLQPDFVLLGRHHSLQLSTSLGVRGEHGLGMRSVWHNGTLSASLSGEWFNYGDSYAASSLSAGNSKPWLPNETGLLGFSLDSVFGRTSVSFLGSVRRVSDGMEIYKSTSMGVSVRQRLYEWATLRSSLSVRIRLERDSYNASVDVRVTFGSYASSTSVLLGAASEGFSSTSTSEERDQVSQSILGIESRWRPDQQRALQLDGALWATSGNSNTALGLDAGLTHRTFKAQIQSQWREQGGGSSQGRSLTDTAIRLSTQIVRDESGMAFAGNEAIRAGFIIDVDGEPAGAEYDIVVNSARVGRGRVGEPAFVALPPFAHYQIQLQPHSLLASTFEQENFEVTLYPGNVLRLNTRARERRLLIATVIGAEGELLSNAVLQREEGALLIGTDGLLQVEASRGEVFQLRRADGKNCQLSVPTELGDEDVVVLDAPMVCQ